MSTGRFYNRGVEDAVAVRSDTSGSVWDLDPTNGDGDFNFPDDSTQNRSNAPTALGMSFISGAVVSASDQAFDVTISWRDPDDNEMFSQTFSSSTGGVSANHNIKFDRLFMKAPRLRITITSTAGGGVTNNVNGAFAFH